MEMKWIVLALAALMYVFVVIFPSKKHWISLGVGALIIIIGAVPVAHAFLTLINWNILGIYIGSLIIAELFCIRACRTALPTQSSIQCRIREARLPPFWL